MTSRTYGLGVLMSCTLLLSSCGPTSTPQPAGEPAHVQNRKSISFDYNLTQVTAASLKALEQSDPDKATSLKTYLERERMRGETVNLSPALSAQQAFYWYHCRGDIDIFDNSPINNTAGGYYKSTCTSNYIVRGEHTLQVYNYDTGDIVDTERVSTNGNVAYGTNLTKAAGFHQYCAYGMIIIRFSDGTYWQDDSDPVCAYMFG